MRDIRLLVDFAAVAEDLSFSQAARRLGVPQPWLSARIRKLEDLFGATLFERSTRVVRLTAEGRQLFDHVRPLAQVAEAVTAEVERMRLGETGQLRIGCPQLGQPDSRQAAMISQFASANPDIVLAVEPGSVDIHVDLLHRGTLDFVMAIVPTGALSEKGLETVELHEVSLAAMMHHHDPLCAVEPLAPAAFRGRRVAMFAPPRASQFHDLIYGPLLAAGAEPVMVPELRRSLLKDAPELIVTTVVPAPAEAQLRYGVVRRTIAGCVPLRLALIRRRSIAHTRANQRFWNFARGLAAAGSQAGAGSTTPRIFAA